MTTKVTLMLIGKTGSGKSTLANALFGITESTDPKFSFKVNEKKSFARRETEISQIHTARRDTLELSVIDTPGLFDRRDWLSGRWFDFLSAISLAGGNRLDAILLVVHIRELVHGALCLEDIKEKIGEHIINRIVIVFTNCNEPTSREKDEYLSKFNSHLSSGAIGASFVFSDQGHRYFSKRESKMNEIVECICKIKKEDPLPIKKGNFVTTTKKVLRQLIVEEDNPNFTYDDLHNIFYFNLPLVKFFLSEEEISKVIEDCNNEVSEKKMKDGKQGKQIRTRDTGSCLLL